MVLVPIISFLCSRQIMFECGRGSKLVDGPPGATCIDGKWVQIYCISAYQDDQHPIFSFNFRWSPETLPRCEVEYHPKMAWLSKRSVAEKVIRIPKRAKRSLRRRQRSSGGGSSNFYGNQKVATTMPNSKLWCHASKNDLQSKMHAKQLA